MGYGVTVNVYQKIVGEVSLKSLTFLWEVAHFSWKRVIISPQLILFKNHLILAYLQPYKRIMVPIPTVANETDSSRTRVMRQVSGFKLRMELSFSLSRFANVFYSEVFAIPALLFRLVLRLLLPTWFWSVNVLLLFWSLCFIVTLIYRIQDTLACMTTRGLMEIPEWVTKLLRTAQHPPSKVPSATVSK